MEDDPCLGNELASWVAMGFGSHHGGTFGGEEERWDERRERWAVRQVPIRPGGDDAGNDEDYRVRKNEAGGRITQIPDDSCKSEGKHRDPQCEGEGPIPG